MKSILRLAAPVLVLAGGASLDVNPQTAPHPPFMVGVLYSDSVLVPLARFEAGKWTAPWPPPADDRVAPPSLAAIPNSWWPGVSGRKWTAALPSGSRPLTVLQPTTVPAGCEKAVALKTDYVNAPPMGDSRFVRLEAIAAAGDVAIRAVKSLNLNGPKDAEWTAAERTLFDALDAMKRPKDGLILQFVSRIPREDGGEVSLFEAVGTRRFVRLFVSDNERGHFVLFKDSSTDRDRELVGAFIPVGAIWGLGALTVLTWEQGFDGGQYAIVTVTAEGVSRLIAAGSGGC